MLSISSCYKLTFELRIPNMRYYHHHKTDKINHVSTQSLTQTECSILNLQLINNITTTCNMFRGEESMALFLFLLQPPPPLVKTVWEERPASRQSSKSGKSLGNTMTKVGGTAKKDKAKSPSRPRVQSADGSAASWVTSPGSGIEVWCIVTCTCTCRQFY